jgi:hypothetical protein
MLSARVAAKHSPLTKAKQIADGIGAIVASKLKGLATVYDGLEKLGPRLQVFRCLAHWPTPCRLPRG